MTCADLIRGNSRLQEGFAQRSVVSIREIAPESQVNGHSQINAPPKVNVIQGLLDLALTSLPIHAFDVRISAFECIKAYLYNHAPIRMHFLQHAIEGHTSRDEVDNILTILIGDTEGGHGADPYRPWIASVILFHLLYESFDAKNLAMKVSEGDAESGEEVVTCIQTLSGSLIYGIRRGIDERIAIGYLMVLCGWMYEDHDAVNDFLGEGSSVQSLVQLLTQNNHQQVLVPGLCAFLLGIVYEFSTRDSPISRATLHQILTTRLGREQYVDKITKLREHPMVRDFEVLSQRLDSSQAGGLPEVYFDRTFVDFLKDNFSRFTRAIDRAPGIEVPVIANGIHKGISRELVDSLEAQVVDRTLAVQNFESDILTLERKLGQEQADHRKAKESATIELSRIKSVNTALQKHHEEDLQRVLKENQLTRNETEKAHDAIVKSLKAELHKLREDGETAAARIRARTEAEHDDLQATIHRLESELEKSSKDHVQDLETAHEDYSGKLSALESRVQRAEDKAKDADMRVDSVRVALDEKENVRKLVQGELDDLLMVLGDLEEKRAGDRVCSTHNDPCMLVS